MSRTMAIARKEWQAAFLSPVALIFLGIFLLASLFVFFFWQGFFARNIADARPFFEGMPILLVLLSSAFTMRLWSEEARSGTLETLLTMPLNIRDIVLGKFLAGVGLVLVALLLTLPVPITVAILGNLDWGPVIGGYLGLVLLAGAYLAIGMFVSSLTANQLVALLMSIVICGALVLLGYLPKLVPMGLSVDQVLRAVGTGSRFESMLRGVLDLRDLVYYISLAAMFLVLNGLVLEKRRWGKSKTGRVRRRNVALGVGLLAANLLVFNLGLAQANRARLDMTEWGEYSISPVTVSLLQGASEPLLVRGYFSDQTHPLLDPLIPRIQDFIRELGTVGGDKVTTEFVDPTSDEEVEKEANSKYGIRPVPFRFADQHRDSVVNAYFHILIRYGDGFEVLDFADLIDVEVKGTDVKVRLRNLEYDVARAVQKTVYGFKSLEAVCNQLADEATLLVFASSENLPEKLAEIPERIEKVAAGMEERCGDKFDYKVIDPDDPSSGITREQLYRQYGIKPMSLSLFDKKTFYLNMVMRIGEKGEALSVPGELSEADIRRELQAVLQRHSPGFLKTIGIAKGEAPPQMNRPGMPPQRGPSFRTLERQLSETYEVTQVDLKSGRVPGHVDVLIVLAPRNFSEREQFAIDQFLMRGGSAIIAGGAYAFEPGMGGTLEVKLKNTGLERMLESYGVKHERSVVLDEENAAFPVPVVRDLGGLRIREIKMIHYPPFVRVHGDGLSRDNPATSTLPQVVLHWPSPVRCVESGEEIGEGQEAPGQEGRATGEPECRYLLWSSDQAWEVPYFKAQPDHSRFERMGFKEPEKYERIPLGVSLIGRFESFFKGKDLPMIGEEPKATPEEGKKEGGHTAGLIERSERQARLIVLGTSNFVNDIVLSISSQVSDAHLSNLQFMSNLADWSVQDEGLLSIRTKERYARTLTSLEPGEMIAWEAGHFGLAILAVVLIGLITLGRRGRARPLLEIEGEDEEGRSS